MSDLPGKNCWTIAEHAGHATPGRLQHLLARAAWDADGVRDDLRGYVTEHLGDAVAVQPPVLAALVSLAASPPGTTFPQLIV